jgi:hypothetical protein
MLVPLADHRSLHDLRLFTEQPSEVLAFAPDVSALENSVHSAGRLGHRYSVSFFHQPNPGVCKGTLPRQATHARDKSRPRRYRQIANVK